MDVRSYKACQDKIWKNKGGNESRRNLKESEYKLETTMTALSKMYLDHALW